MKLYPLQLAVALATTAGGAHAFPQPTPLNLLDGFASTVLSVGQVRGDAGSALKSIESALRRSPQLACNKCRSGFALKIVEEAWRKQPALSNDQYLEVQRLHDEGEALFNQAKYLESLELSRKAQSILGIDPSGAVQAPQGDGAPRAGAEPTPGR